MSNVYKGEFQDYEGNVVYPHSQADVVFCTDGETVQSKLNKTENAIGGVTGKTNSLEVSDDKILPTSEVTHELATMLTVPEDGVMYYADKKDGKYGVNTDPNRGADTFIPFKIGSVVMSFSGGYRGSTTLTNVNSIDFSESNYSYDSGSTKPYIALYGFKNNVSTTIFNSSTQPINKYDVSEYDYIEIRIGNTQGNNYQTYINNVIVEFS